MIPVGPGGTELSLRTEMVVADAIALFKQWRRQCIDSNYPPTPEEIAMAWGSSLWTAIGAREQVEGLVLNAFAKDGE